jgi:carbonic anhydrase
MQTLDLYQKNTIVTSTEALQLLREGNYRFTHNISMNRDMLQKVLATKDQQKPFAAILSCMDSRVPAEIIFDLGIGDIFSIRIAGNIISEYVLGSLEYAAAVNGVRLIVVMGHTCCGAVRGACDKVQMGHLTSLISKIERAITAEESVQDNRTGNNDEFVNKVSAINIHNSIRDMVHQSEILRDLMENAGLRIVPAMYDVATGIVDFFDDRKM